jgi:hypothetical protein
MTEAVKQKEFRELPASYFREKASQVRGPQKLLVMLEMSKYLTAAREHGLSFEKLKELGFRFATV